MFATHLVTAVTQPFHFHLPFTQVHGRLIPYSSQDPIISGQQVNMLGTTPKWQ